MVMTSIIKKAYWPKIWKAPHAKAAITTQAIKINMLFNIMRIRSLRVNF